MRCEDLGISTASFFFLHSQPERNNAGYLVATLVNQFTQHFPALSTMISQAIEDDPLIFGKVLGGAISEIDIEPICALRAEQPALGEFFTFSGNHRRPRSVQRRLLSSLA